MCEIEQVWSWDGGYTRVMVSDVQILTAEEFASLLRVGDLSDFRDAPAVIRAKHKARLIALGYLVDLDGRLRMTTPGRYRIYAGQLAR